MLMLAHHDDWDFFEVYMHDLLAREKGCMLVQGTE